MFWRKSAKFEKSERRLCYKNQTDINDTTVIPHIKKTFIESYWNSLINLT